LRQWLGERELENDIGSLGIDALVHLFEQRVALALILELRVARRIPA
jgi:hypothetical protein